MKNLYVYIIIVVLLWACDKTQVHENAVARVYDKYLLEEEINQAMPNNISSEDSIVFRNNYINNWAKNELLLQKAQLNVSDDNDEIKKLVADYRKELLIDKYKKALLQQELDTTITENIIDQFYESNKTIYRLNEDLIQLKYIHFSNNINDKKELIKLFKSDKNSDLAELESRELEFNSYSLNDSIWLSVNTVKKKLPFIFENSTIKKTDFLQKEDSLGVYLVAVKNVLYRNDIAPKSYVIPTIKQMILHKRKLELMKSIEQMMMSDAISNKQFEQYKK